MINHNEKEYYKYMYVHPNHFAVQQQLTQHCKTTVIQFFFKKMNIFYLNLTSSGIKSSFN